MTAWKQDGLVFGTGETSDADGSTSCVRWTGSNMTYNGAMLGEVIIGKFPKTHSIFLRERNVDVSGHAVGAIFQPDNIPHSGRLVRRQTGV